MHSHRTIALILAAGYSSRFIASCKNVTSGKKQYCILKNGLSVLERSLNIFLQCKEIDAVRVVIDKDDEKLYSAHTKNYSDGKLLLPVYGGKRRQDSLKNGVMSLQNESCEIVLVHDVARCNVSTDIINSVIHSVYETKICTVPIVPIEDSILCSENGCFTHMDRANKYCLQTPQGCAYNVLNRCMQTVDFKKNFTDESSIILACGESIKTVCGEKSNIKITYIEDLEFINRSLL